MRILLVTRDLPFFPGGHGGNTRTFSLLRALAGRHRFTVVSNVHSAAQRAAADVLAKLVERVEIYDTTSNTAATADAGIISRGLALARRDPARFVALASTYARAQLAWLPREAALGELTLANLHAPLQRALAAGPYDLLQIECSDSARWATRIPFRGPKILVVQDVKTLVWWRRFRAGTNVRDRGRALYESARFAAYERQHLRAFDALIAMSDADREVLTRLTQHPHIVVVPNGVDLAYFQPAPTDESTKRVVFTATLDHPPNRDGIIFFAREIWPLVLREEPDAQLDIVGANPPTDVRALASARIRVTGFVPDVRPYLAAADVFVCPLRFASGTRLKILEAMAMRRPVVATTVGAEGLDGRSGTEIYIADDRYDFARRVIDLLRDRGARERMGNAAREMAARYGWAESAARLDHVYGEVQQRCAARRTARPLRVGLNGLFMVPGGATGGLEPYFRNLVTHLLRLDRETQYVLLANAANAADLATLRGENLQRRLVARGSNPLAGIDVDFVHSFPGYIDPPVEDFPNVLTVADLQHEHHPELFDADELAARRALYPRSARRALRIIAISAFTGRSLVERYHVPDETIRIIPLAVASRFTATIAASAVQRVRSQHRLPDEYVIYAANLWPHKNHLRLLDALARIAVGERPHLVLTGAAPRASVALSEAVRTRDLGNHVSWLGFVDDNDMPALLAGARMMVFPSLFEGFGMPVIEAMAAGCPVACSNAAALPETAGEAARYFDPLDIDAIATAITELWHDAPLREQLRRAGHERARQFSWQRTALLTLQLYREVGQVVR